LDDALTRRPPGARVIGSAPHDDRGKTTLWKASSTLQMTVSAAAQVSSTLADCLCSDGRASTADPSELSSLRWVPMFAPPAPEQGQKRRSQIDFGGPGTLGSGSVKC
jgi:hypothetical protein